MSVKWCLKCFILFSNLWWIVIQGFKNCLMISGSIEWAGTPFCYHWNNAVNMTVQHICRSGLDLDNKGYLYFLYFVFNFDFYLCQIFPYHQKLLCKHVPSSICAIKYLTDSLLLNALVVFQYFSLINNVSVSYFLA